MREIKFRVWDKKNKKWCCGIYISLTGVLWKVNQTNPLAVMDMQDPIRYEIIWYTGLKDKHGKEIYEGNIVSTIYKNIEYKSRVEWGDVGWLPFSRCCHGGATDWEESDYVIIGNIWENPELVGE